MIDRFSWRSYDLNTLLPADWQQAILNVSEDAIAKTLKPRSVTSREGDPDLSIPVLTVDGTTVRHRLPWLYSLYEGLFRDLAQLGTHEPVSVAANAVYGATLNVQRGVKMRYECHVDSNPIEGLLYVTDHPKGSGGELVVANSTMANSVSEVDADCSVVYPASGNLIFFDARRFAHYVRPLTSDSAVRVVVAMNFYTPSSSEADRPKDLSGHLFGYQE
ncbi:MAG: 2OG-Fe(II) oxygenase [Fimbriimonadaceae bacterium]|nr:2OG-Fe(II) oxygenase [Fimbriimonadaceae bacterium]QYK58051.1 MAG: 2OG-Fe(II) oxygenase [Fimbriimonadaceae bacterium]